MGYCDQLGRFGELAGRIEPAELPGGALPRHQRSERTGGRSERTGGADITSGNSGFIHDDAADRDTGFTRLDPALSARSGLTGAQLAFIGVAAGTLGVCTAKAPDATVMMLGMFLAIAFAALLCVRLYAIYVIAGATRHDVLVSAAQPRMIEVRDRPEVPVVPELPVVGDVPEASLPFYTVLVTLYDEANVVQSLVAALDALEYPRDRLEIVFLLEADDGTTRRALEAARLGGHMRIVVVPDGLPRTKPRALCYGLARTSGDYVVVFDAEDRPEPGQLREAVLAFRRGGSQLGCLQAHLNVYNPSQSLISGQFAVEYTALFDGILPALAKAGAPVPLGGTSNHLPRPVLEHVGGWDPWNVTEDADLGLRLARHGFRVEALQSTTWEEAPPTFGVWFRQRTRWHKGWMQTYMVHMRDPVGLWRDLGTARFLWFQVLFGGGLLAAATHPWFVAGLMAALIAQGWMAQDGRGVEELVGGYGLMWWAGFVCLVGAAAAAIVLSLITTRRRGFTGLASHAIMCPLIWLPVSLAAYCAVIELLRRPFHWAKTPHGAGQEADTADCEISRVAPARL